MNNILKLYKYNFVLSVAIVMLFWQYVGYSYEIKGITKPQSDVFLAFTTSGKIGDIYYKEGDVIAEGEVIATLEMQPEKIRLEQLALEADNESEIKANKLELRQKEYDLSRMINAHIEGAAADSELDNARLAVDIAKLRLEQAQHQKQLTELRFSELKAEIDRRKLISPIDGVIEILEIDPGESVEALRPVVRIVVQDRLWVDMMVPLELLPEIKSMIEIPVKVPDYADRNSDMIVKGKIEYIAALADSASETVKIRVGIDNPKMWPIGTPVVVELPDNSTGDSQQTKKSVKSETVVEKYPQKVDSADKLFLPMLQIE